MRHYPGAPQFMNPQGAMAAPMMVQQPSGGPYMGVPQGMAPYAPQMQMYSPNPGQVYPQHAPPPQPHSGFPSPSRGAPMMMHQNSQPGQPPQSVMFMAPGQPGQPLYPAQQAGHGKLFNRFGPTMTALIFDSASGTRQLSPTTAAFPVKSSPGASLPASPTSSS